MAPGGGSRARVAPGGGSRAGVLVAALAAGAAALLAVGPARGQLRAEAERLAVAWRDAGAAVVVDRSRFLIEDQTLVVRMPDLPAGACTTLVLLGPRGLGFHVTLPGANGDDPSSRLASEAGGLSLDACGDLVPKRLAVTSDSGRGALEVIAARSPKPLVPLALALPERTGGGIGPLTDPGALAPLPPPERRADVAESRARRDGAAVFRRSTWRSGVDGAGAGEETLAPGCHTFRLFALDLGSLIAGRRGKLDLDAEMRDVSHDRLLARDRTDAPDAQLSTCVGEITRIAIVFVGSPAGAPVLVSHVGWGLPEHLTGIWGSEARARMGRVLAMRHLGQLPAEPIQLAQGGTGVTEVPLSIEPGACYVAVAVAVEGDAHAVALRVRVGARDATDDRGIDDAGSAVAFCAAASSVAVAEVEARGAPLLGWGLSLYRVEGGVWEPPS